MAELWDEMLDVLKDISGYLEKQDATQERAKIDRPPKVQETQKPIKGGESPGFAPAKGIAKEYVPVSSEGTSVGEDALSEATESTMLKQKDKEEDEEEVEELEETPEDEEEKETSDIEELKSLLKDISSALRIKKGEDAGNISKAVVAELKKSLPSVIQSETHKMLRKMGFAPARPDILKLGIDEDIKKSEEKTSDEAIAEVEKHVTDQTKKSWQELGVEREKLGHFRPF